MERRVLNRSVQPGPFEKLALSFPWCKGEIGKGLIPCKISPDADLASAIKPPAALRRLGLLAWRLIVFLNLP